MKVNVVGLGYWGKNIVRNLLRYDKVEDVYVYDVNKKAVNNIKSSFPPVKVLDSMKQVLENDAEVVYIITPPDTHYELGKSVLEAEKHLYLEKPFVTSKSGAEKIINLAEKKSLKVMSGHTFLYSPPVRKIKNIVEKGELGSIEYISFRRINLGIHQRAVNVVWDLLPHDLSMISYWLGKNEKFVDGEVFLKKSIGKHPDIGFVFLEFKSGAIAEGLVSWLSPKKIRETIIVGSKKMLVYNDTEPEEKIKIYDKKVEKMEPDDFGEYQLSYRVGDINIPRLDTTEPLFMMVKDFIDSIEKDENPLSDGRFALNIVSTIENLLNK